MVRSKRQYRFSLKALLLLIVLVSVGCAWVMYHRERGTDALHYALQYYGAESDEGYIRYETHGRKNAPGVLQSWMGNQKKEVRKINIRCNPVDEFIRALHRNRTTDSIQSLTFRPTYAGRPEIDTRLDCFFEHWSGLKQLILRNAEFTESWISSIGRTHSLEEIIISGSMCNLQPEHLTSLPNLKSLTLCHRGIDAMRLEEIQKLLPQVNVTILGSPDSQWDFDDEKIWPPQRGLSAHDPDARDRMKKLLDDLVAEIEKYEEVKLSPPATAEDIVTLERSIGLPLPREIRAFLEITNGWQGAPLHSFMSTEQIARNFDSRMDIATYDYGEYDFTPHYDHYSNPNVIPLATTMGISVFDGSVWSLDEGGESGPSSKPHIKNLEQYFELMIEELRTSKREELYDEKYGLELQGDYWWQF